jgi:ribosome maturation factor RimP
LLKTLQRQDLKKGSFMARKMLSIFLAALLTHQPIQLLFSSDQQQSVKDVIQAAKVKERVEGLGVGAEVTVKLNDGREQRGRIDNIAEENFQLTQNNQTFPLRYVDVADLHLVNPKYKAKGQVDPIRVRQVVINLGVGQQAKLKLISGVKIIGDIRAIDKEAFAIFDSGTNKRTSVPFSEVSELEKKSGSMGTGKQLLGMAIGVGAAIAILLAITLARGGVD